MRISQYFDSIHCDPLTSDKNIPTHKTYVGCPSLRLLKPFFPNLICWRMKIQQTGVIGLQFWCDVETWWIDLLPFSLLSQTDPCPPLSPPLPSHTPYLFWWPVMRHLHSLLWCAYIRYGIPCAKYVCHATLMTNDEYPVIRSSKVPTTDIII